MLPLIGNANGLVEIEFGSSKTWSSVASTTSEQTVTIPGLKTTDKVMAISKPTHQTGLGITGHRVSAADTLAITFQTTATVTPTANETYTAWIWRSEKPRTDAAF